MAKVYFYYGTMRSSKTAQILIKHYQYKDAGINVVLAKPAHDIRTKTIWSRAGMEAPCLFLEELLALDESKLRDIEIIIVDEAQFLTKDQVDKLVYFADYFGIIIMCYGLKNDSEGELFEGSKRLIEMADEICQLESLCWCGKPALIDGYVENGKLVGNPKGNGTAKNDSSFYPLCRKHFFEGKFHA